MDAEFELDPGPHELTERLEELREAAERERAEAAEEIALRVVADARRKVNVDTGRLRSSIDFEVIVEGEVVEIRVGSNVEYAIFQEVDSPYLRPAFSDNETKIERILTEMYENAAEEAGLT